MAGPLADTEPYYDLGGYRRAVDTPSAAAALWFNRGLVWAYAFNHEEAVRCFERALELDDGLAIARWGIAYAIGPNYNKAGGVRPRRPGSLLARARAELRRATQGRSNALERGLIEALGARFPTDDPDDADALAAGHTAYADAMAALAQAYPDDVDVLALAADAAVNITAWALWDTATGAPARIHGCSRPRLPGPRAGQRRRAGHPACCTCTSTPWRCRPTRGRAARRRPVARAGARRRAPAAHAVTHRRAVRRVPRIGAGQPGGGAGRPPFRAARRPAELLPCTRARPALCRLFGDVRRAVTDRAAGRRRTVRAAHRGTAVDPSRRWRTGSRPSSRCGCMC